MIRRFLVAGVVILALGCSSGVPSRETIKRVSCGVAVPACGIVERVCGTSGGMNEGE